MCLTPVTTANAPIPNAPYSQAIKARNLLFVSGCVPLDKETMTVKAQGIGAQALQALANLKAIVEGRWQLARRDCQNDYGYRVPLRAANLAQQVFIKNMDEFARMNAVYADFFGSHKPARSCVEVARLPLDVRFEIECIALIE